MAYDPTKDEMDAQRSTAISSQARAGNAVIPSDTVDLTTYAKGLYIGSAGDIKILPVNNDDSNPITLANHPVGYLRYQVRRVYATGTMASGILTMED